MIPLWILGAGQFFAEIFIEKLIEENIVERVRADRIRQKIVQKIQEVLEETILDFPDGRYIFENFDIQSYLSNSLVQYELATMIGVSENQPNLELLKDIWVDMLGGQNKGNYQLVVNKFVSSLHKRLWEIEEIRERLHYKDERYSSNLIREYLPEILQKLDTALASLPSKDDNDKSNLVFQGQLDLCKSLLKEGTSAIALVQLLKLEDEYQNQPRSNSLKSKLQGMIGACLFDVGKEEEAADRFVRSYEISSDDPEAMANFALANLIRGKFDQAIEQANVVLAIKPTGTTARSVRLEAQARKQDFKNLVQLVEKDFLEDNNYVHTLGLILSREKNDLADAEKYLKMSWALSPGDMHVGLTLANMFVQKQIKDRFPYGPNVIGDIQFKEQIKEVLEIIERVLEKVKKGDNVKKQINVLASRAGIRGMYGDVTGAKLDCNEVLREDPNYPLGLHNQGLIALIEADYELAVTNFSKLPTDYIIAENLALPFARAYLGLGKPKDALNFIHQLDKNIVKPYQLIEYSVMEAMAYIQNGEMSEALKIKNNLMEKQDKSDSLEAVGTINVFLKNYDEAVENFKAAILLVVSDIDKKRLIFAVANAFYNLRQFDSAVEWFEKLEINFSGNLELARAYVSATYAAREYGKAYMVAQQLRNSGIDDIFLVDVEAWIAEFLGDLKHALSLGVLQLKLRPLDVAYQVNIARLEFRLENSANAIKILEQINLDNVGAFELMQVSEMYLFIQQYDKAIETAFRGYRKGKNIPEIHRSYLSLFLRLETFIELKREAVEIDTAVLLENEQQKRWMKIVSLVPPNDPLEYSSDNEVSKILMGNKVGNVINYSDNSFQKTDFVVKEIQSIFVRAFQEIIEDYGLKFPGDKGLQSINIKEDDYSPFLLVVAKMGIDTEKIHEFFRAGAITIEKYCDVTSRNQVLAYRALQLSPGERIVSSLGTHYDQQIQNRLAGISNPLTLCLSSLLTFDYLECLELLPLRFSKLFVSQNLVDELEKTLYDLDRDQAMGRQSVGYHGGRFFMSETSKEEILQDKNCVTRLLEFVKKYAEVIPISPELAEFLIEIEDKELISVGKVSNSSALVAKTTGTALLCDELALAKYAHAKYGILSFWSQPLCLDLKARNLIDETKYSDICYKLLHANYYFTAVDYEAINTILFEDNYQSSKRFDSMLLGLRGPDTLEIDAIMIAAKIVRFLYFSAPLREQKRFVLDKLLYTLIAGRIKDRVLTKLQILVNREFNLAPVQADEFNNDIELWRKINKQPNELMWFPRI